MKHASTLFLVRVPQLCFAFAEAQLMEWYTRWYCELLLSCGLERTWQHLLHPTTTYGLGRSV